MIMVVKNKLYKHHKSKIGLIVRNLSIAISSFIAIVALAAIPTYISSSSNTEVKANNSADEVSEKSDVEVEEEALASYLEK